MDYDFSKLGLPPVCSSHSSEQIKTIQFVQVRLISSDKIFYQMVVNGVNSQYIYSESSIRRCLSGLEGFIDLYDNSL